MHIVIRLAVAWGTTAIFLLFGERLLGDLSSGARAAFLFAWLFGVILWSSFGAIKEADLLGAILGEPLGSLVLALSIILIEVVLIATMVLGSEQGATVGRDTVFAAIMIVGNLVLGLSLLLGGLKHGEQNYNLPGAAAYLAVIIPLATIGLILPSFTTASPTGSVTPIQAAATMVATLFLYGVFLAIQVGRHSAFFAEAPGGAAAGVSAAAGSEPGGSVGKHTLLLIVSILPIVLLAKQLAKLIDHGIALLGAPPALGGILIALLVISPKGVSAVKAALANQPQKAMNLGIGSAAPAIGLTIPVILAIGLITGKTLIMGLVPGEMVLLALTLILSTLTFSGPRTTLLEGAAHLVVFFIYIVLVFAP